jgi:YteA family regulatory protein
MKKEMMEYYKDKLQIEKKRVTNLIHVMKENGVTTNSEIASELSFYDNHPSDLATEISDIEKGRALKANEISIMKKIDSCLKSIKEGNYGICKMCGKEINSERLDFIPYAEYCTECQNSLNSIKPAEDNDRPVEEEVLGNPFGYGYNDFTDKVQFDAEDSYQAVERFNRMDNIEEFYHEDELYVEPIEAISNEQYKNQLPD